MRSVMGKQKRFIGIATPMKLMSTTPFDNTKNIYAAALLISYAFITTKPKKTFPYLLYSCIQH